MLRYSAKGQKLVCLRAWLIDNYILQNLPLRPELPRSRFSGPPPSPSAKRTSTAPSTKASEGFRPSPTLRQRTASKFAATFLASSVAPTRDPSARKRSQRSPRSCWTLAATKFHSAIPLELELQVIGLHPLKANRLSLCLLEACFAPSSTARIF